MPVPYDVPRYGSHPSYDPYQRSLHVVIAGAGPSGIALAIELKKIPTITIAIYEKIPKLVEPGGRIATLVQRAMLQRMLINTVSNLKKIGLASMYTINHGLKRT